MKTVALLSGGKDSVYNLLHCVLNGHEPVAVASLGPPEGKDELDSFMYQTVGHSGLRTLADALGLPFFSHVIGGTAVNVGGEYGSRKGKGKAVEGQGEVEVVQQKDETEDLYELLKKVKMDMPEVEAVSAGAILSNYQRVRVEHVCQRLGLTPIAYLWERNQKELLSEMVNAGMECVLVKVAGAGLQVDHLGKTLGEMQPTLHRLNQRYQLHICGEGGEYETFTVDCPLFKRRVILDKTTTLISDPNPFSTVAHLHLDSVSLGPLKPDVPQEETFEEMRERIKAIFEERGGVPEVVEERTSEWREEGEEVERRVAERESEEEARKSEEDAQVNEEEAECSAPQARTTDDGWVYFGEVGADEAETAGAIEDEVKGCFAKLEALLNDNSASLLSLTHLTVLLSPSSTMSLFPRINAVYSSYFGTSPPTRACVAVSGEEPGEGKGRKGWRVKLEGVARKSGVAEERKALHVQSLSYWAAANIGPYSQSVKTANRLYIAGQIPLIPATLTLPPPSTYPPISSSPPSTSFSHHAALSLQHLRRIVSASLLPSGSLSSSTPIGRAEGAIVWVAPSSSSHQFRTRAAAARAVWEASEKQYLSEQEEAGEEGVEEGKTAPFLVVEAGMLPKGAEVEWQVTWGCPATASGDDEDDEEGDKDGQVGETWAGSLTGASGCSAHAMLPVLPKNGEEQWLTRSLREVTNETSSPVTYQCSQAFPPSSSSSPSPSVFAVLGCSADESRPQPLPGLDSSNLHTIRAFYRPGRVTPSRVRALVSTLFSLPSLPSDKQPVVSLVPSARVATVLETKGGEVVEHDVGFVIVGGPARG
ncbi:hypothetical protein JCM11251_007862 [Rhodosporidiobolus azoricus]